MSVGPEMVVRISSRKLALLLVIVISHLFFMDSSPVRAATTVVIQPSSIDTYVDLGNPTKNFSPQNWLRVDASTGHLKRTLVSFDLSSVPAGQIIVSAIILLYMATPPSIGRTFGAHRITSNWTERSVTWNTQPSFLQTPTSTNTTGIQVQWLNWNVTSDVSSGYSNPASWLGILIMDEQESSSGGGLLTSFNSRDNPNLTLAPKLAVTYALQIPEVPVWAGLLLVFTGVAAFWRIGVSKVRLGAEKIDSTASSRHDG